MNAVDVDLSHLAQGDILADLYTCWLGGPDFHVIPIDEEGHLTSPIRLSQGGTDVFRQSRQQLVVAFAEQTNVMLLSQTCDIVQPGKEMVVLAPVRQLTELPEQQRGNCRSNRLPWAFFLPEEGSFPECFTDLRLIVSVDKRLLTGCRKTRSLTPSLATKLTQVLAAWFTRPALPDEVVQTLRPFVDQVKGWSRASQDKIHGFYLRQDGLRLQLLAVMNERAEDLERRVRQAVEKAARQSPGFVIDLAFESVTTTTLAHLEGFLLLDLGYLSYPV
jgi:hypothetical protein